MSVSDAVRDLVDESVESSYGIIGMPIACTAMVRGMGALMRSKAQR